MKPVYKKLLFKRLLYKLTGENTFQFNTKFFETMLFKQIDGCSKSGPLSVNLSDIHMTRTGNNIVTHEKPLFCSRFVDDIICRRKKNEHDIICKNLNKYHPKINLTIEVNLCKFLDSKSLIKETSQQTFFVKRPNYPCIGHPGLQYSTSKILDKEAFMDQREYLATLNWRLN